MTGLLWLVGQHHSKSASSFRRHELRSSAPQGLRLRGSEGLHAQRLNRAHAALGYMVMELGSFSQEKTVVWFQLLPRRGKQESDLEVANRYEQLRGTVVFFLLRSVRSA